MTSASLFNPSKKPLIDILRWIVFGFGVVYCTFFVTLALSAVVYLFIGGLFSLGIAGTMAYK
jgi:hypothetical protein